MNLDNDKLKLLREKDTIHIPNMAPIPKETKRASKQPDILTHKGAKYFHQNYVSFLQDVIIRLGKELEKHGKN